MADSKQTLQQFRSHILKQNVLKSVLFGLLIGLCASFMSALVSWFFGYDGGLWLSIGILVGTTAVGSVILYFTKFRVTDSLMARRIDMLGLRERIVTMMELEKEESFMAKRQREDAEEKLKTVSPKQLKFRMARKAIACIATAAVVAPAMMVVCELAALGILDSGLDIINPNANIVADIELVYEVEEGGWIDGEEIQVLTDGQEPTPVMAIADDGWVFVCWDDGSYDPYRHDKGVTESKTFVAIFEELEDEEDKEGNGSGSGQGSGQGEGDGAGDAPGGEGEGSGNGNGSGQGQGKGEGEGEGEGQGEGAGGKHSQSNVIIDGKTDYGDLFDDFFDVAMDSLTEGDGSSTEGDVIGNYFEGLS